MKVIFVIDDQSVIVATPEELQLRQVGTGLAALSIPAGKNDEGQDLYRPLITYPVVLVAPPPPEPDPVPEEPAIQ